MLLGLQPPHDVDVKTHLGGGVLMRRTSPSVRRIGIDEDPCALAGLVCDDPVELIAGCAYDCLARFPFQGTDCVDSDPPALRKIRRFGKRLYRHDDTEADHMTLLGRLVLFGDGLWSSVGS